MTLKPIAQDILSFGQRLTVRRKPQFRLDSRAAAVLLVAWTALLLLIPLKTPFNWYDEGFAVFNATRVMSGDLPHRDFWAVYPPGQFYALAAVLKTLGTTVLSARIYDTVVRLAIVIAVYLLAKRIVSHGLAFLAGVLAGLLLASVGYYGYAVLPAQALGVYSILSLLEYASSGRPRWLILAGILTGIASLFRLDIAAYAAVSVVLTLSVFSFLMLVWKDHCSTIEALRTTLQQARLVCVSALAIALPLYGCLGLLTGFGALWTQLLVVPTTVLQSMRRLPYPTLQTLGIAFWPLLRANSVAAARNASWVLLIRLLFYIPLATYGIVFIRGSRALVTRCIPLNERHWGQAAASIFGALLFAQALSRFDSVHVLPTSIVAIPLILSLGEQAVLKVRNGLVKTALIALPIAFLVIFSFSTVGRLLSFLESYSPLSCHSRLARASCAYVSADYEQAVKYIDAQTPNGESIFVGNRRHDLIFVNDIGFYFLADRPSATFYHELYPGVATTLPVQEAIVNDIETGLVNWVVLVNIPESHEPNASSVSSGVHYLDQYIRSRFLPVMRFGAYEIWHRSDAEAKG